MKGILHYRDLQDCNQLRPRFRHEREDDFTQLRIPKVPNLNRN